MATRNPAVRGAVADRPMRDALIAELQQSGEEPDGQPPARIRLVARRLIESAIEGEAAAIKEIFDRVDGRTNQAVERLVAGGPTIEEALAALNRKKNKRGDTVVARRIG
jgi:hypothetical protein